MLMPSSNGLSFLESALATVALGLVALKTARQGERRHLGWAFLTLAMLANTLGEATWWLIQQTQGEVPVSSVADIVYLAFYPLFAIGLVLLPVAPQRFVERRRIALDMGSAFLAGTLVFWVFGIGPALAGSPIDKVELATALAYPAGDVALFWALLVLISRPVPAASQPALRLLAGGVAVMLVTDSLYSYQAITGVYASGDFLDLGYTVMCILYGLAAMREITLLPRDLDGGRAGAQDDGPPGPLVNWSLGLPYAAMLFAFALLVWDHFRPTGVDFPVLVAFLGGIIALLEHPAAAGAVGERRAPQVGAGAHLEPAAGAGRAGATGRCAHPGTAGGECGARRGNRPAPGGGSAAAGLDSGEGSASERGAPPGEEQPPDRVEPVQPAEPECARRGPGRRADRRTGAHPGHVADPREAVRLARPRAARLCGLSARASCPTSTAPTGRMRPRSGWRWTCRRCG